MDQQQRQQLDQQLDQQRDKDDNDSDDVESNPKDLAYDRDADKDETALEPWEYFIRRATQAAEQALSSFKMENWIEAYWRRKWAWEHRVALHDSERWTQKVTRWQPEWDPVLRATRAQARPRMRWDDEIHQLFKEVLAEPKLQWTSIASDSKAWLDLSQCFLKEKTARTANDTTRHVSQHVNA